VRPVSITHRNHFVNIARRRALEANNLAAAQRESNKAQTNGLAYVNSEIPHSGKSYPNSDSKGGFFAYQFENMANYRAHYEWNRQKRLCMPLLLQLVLVVQLQESHGISRFACFLTYLFYIIYSQINIFLYYDTLYSGKEQKHQMLFDGPAWIWSVQ
jgi:hypothetical protein